MYTCILYKPLFFSSGRRRQRPHTWARDAPAHLARAPANSGLGPLVGPDRAAPYDTQETHAPLYPHTHIHTHINRAAARLCPDTEPKPLSLSRRALVSKLNGTKRRRSGGGGGAAAQRERGAAPPNFEPRTGGTGPTGAAARRGQVRAHR